MSSITAFGKALRDLRYDRQLTMFELAKRLKVSSAFLSGVESGKKAIPKDFCEKIGIAMELSLLELNKLKLAAELSSREIKLNLENANSESRMLAVVFARKFESLGETDKAKIIQLLNNAGESHARQH